MGENDIAARKAVVVDPAERQRRLGSVYVLLLDLAREKRAAEQEQVSIMAQSVS